MVDETAFRKVLRSTDPEACAFGKAILSTCCACSLAARHHLAEREMIVCTDAAALVDCAALHRLLLHNSAFALKHLHDTDPLTHAQEMKVQCGGLLGLQRAVNEAEVVTDIAVLVDAAYYKFGSLEQLPYSQIVQSVAALKLRKRHEED